MSKKRIALVASIILFSFVLMTYQTRMGGINPLKIISYPVNYANEIISSVSLDIKDFFRKLKLTGEENKKLKEQIDALLIEEQGYQEILLENFRLREILNLKKTEKRSVAVAKVIAKGSNRWVNTLVINKGTAHGIEKDMIVITPEGLAGKIISSTESYSSILLLNDINFSVSVRLEDSRVEGILSGTGSKTCVLKYISHEIEAAENDTVITSGLDGIFPPGIPVGTVTKISKNSPGLFQDITVIPFQDNSKLEEVLVVKK
ncbi:MAG: rod shape-determining protein MreC [Nitrospiraceae bacterium]|nr:rod shape-determining protein MreC [Nitrospiraceae bacterium]